MNVVVYQLERRLYHREGDVLPITLGILGSREDAEQAAVLAIAWLKQYRTAGRQVLGINRIEHKICEWRVHSLESWRAEKEVRDG